MIKLNMKIALLACITVLGNYVVVHAAAEGFFPDELIKACAQVGKDLSADNKIPKYNNIRSYSCSCIHSLWPAVDSNLELVKEDTLVENATISALILRKTIISETGYTDNVPSDNDEFVD